MTYLLVFLLLVYITFNTFKGRGLKPWIRNYNQHPCLNNHIVKSHNKKEKRATTRDPRPQTKIKPCISNMRVNMERFYRCSLLTKFAFLVIFYNHVFHLFCIFTMKFI